MEFLLLFIILSLVNVILNTIKSIVTVTGKTIVSAVVNAITFFVYTYVVIYTASDELEMLTKAIITAITNFIGVYISAWILKALRKDRLWEIVATTKRDDLTEIIDYLSMHKISFNYNITDNYKDTKIVFRIYSENQKQSIVIKNILKKYNAKYIVHEETVKL